MPDELNQDPEHGGVTDEALEAFLQEHFGDTTETPSAPAAPEGGDGGEEKTVTPPAAPSGEETEEPTPTPTVPAGDETWQWDDGVQISKGQARNLAEFEAFLQANPQIAEQIAGVASGQLKTEPVEQPAAPVTPTATPDEVDLDDPAVKKIWDELTATKGQLDKYRETVERHETQLTNQSQATTQSLIKRAAASFQQQHKLSDEEIARVREVAGRLQVLPSLMAPTDPLTGQPRQVDPLEALEAAFDIAFWRIPELRDRAINTQLEAQQEEIKKKAKLSSLGGSSGSVPRQGEPIPDDPAKRKEAMIREVAGLMSGTAVNPDDEL